MEGGDEQEQEEGVEDELHVVVVPLPSQGHIAPALLLSKKLAALGIRITFVNTSHNHHLMLNAQASKPMPPDLNGIDFCSVADGLPDDHPRAKKWNEFSRAILAMGPTFEAFYLNLMQRSPITCVIRDIRFTAAHESATKLGIPVVAFATCSTIAMQCALKVPMLLAMGILPLPAPPMNAKPSIHPVFMTLCLPRSEQEASVRHLPLSGVINGVSSTMMVEDMPTHFLTHELVKHWNSNPLMSQCDALLFNSFHALEGDVLDAIAKDLQVPVFAMGPLILDSTTTTPANLDDGGDKVAVVGGGGILHEESSIALSWLDSQNPKSVLYISFGSEAMPSKEQLVEFAHGLEMSGHVLLWVIRLDIRKNLEEKKEKYLRPDFDFLDFVARTKDRNLVVSWAPQVAVLSHPSIGAFLTHCGWNSTLESITSGVPMLGWPRFADQTTNCHYITQVWKVGLTLNPSHESMEDGSMIVNRGEVERKVRMMLMVLDVDKEVDEIRKNSQKFKLASRQAIVQGGLSHVAFVKFMALVKSWKINNIHRI